MAVKQAVGTDDFARNIAEKLTANIGKIQYGTCAVVVVIHQGRAVNVKLETTERTTQKEEVQ